VETLVSLCPIATITRKDPGGQLPLHAACTWGASLDVILFLIGIHPQACSQMDDLGNLPVHCACFSGCSEEVMDALLQAYPRSVMIRNEHGSVPSDVVRRLRHWNKRSILSLLEKVELNILLRPRSMSQELTSTVVIVPTKHSSLNEMDQNTCVDVGFKDSEPMSFVEQNDIVEDDGMVWI
jgi:ankyrin repeat protein